jgi:hypothetical protein
MENYSLLIYKINLQLDKLFMANSLNREGNGGKRKYW